MAFGADTQEPRGHGLLKLTVPQLVPPPILLQLQPKVCDWRLQPLQLPPNPPPLLHRC